MEYFSIRLLQLQEQGLLKGIQLGRGGKYIFHLCYADDLLVFYNGKTNHIETLKYSISSFCEVSGQSVSLAKSQIIFSKNMQRVHKIFIKSSLSMNEMPSDFIYLGNPYSLNKLTRAAYSFLIDMIHKKLKG